LLKERGIEFRYRDYTEEPLTASQLRELLPKLGPAAGWLRKREKAYKALGLTGNEGLEVLAKLILAHPTLLQRPIGVLGDKAALGRPPEDLLSLLP
jgi:arsenate reductase (glutaredoxin)